jgi:hypothetical protein
MRGSAFIAAVLLAAPAFAQESGDADAGFGLIDPAQSPPVEVPASVAPEPAPIGTPDPVVTPPEAAPEPAPSWIHKVEATGYFSARAGWSRSHIGGLVPTDDLPQLSLLGELNGQVKVKYLERSFIYGDVSLIAQAGGFFRGTDKDGNEVDVRDHNLPAIQPAVSINELYVLHEFLPALNVLVGKKRIVWGSGQAYNPTDLLNVRKDPTDPTFQRAGAWMARVEVPLESLAFTAVFAPSVLKQVSGIPQNFVAWPDWDKKDEQAHYLLALRAYALIADADVNLMVFFSNLYGDSFKDKVRVGGSFSRYFFTDYELHAELLMGTGSSRDYLDHDCTVSGMAAFACSQSAKAFIGKSKLNDDSYYPKLLVGTRRQFNDESFLSLEYLYQAEGLSKTELQDQANALDLIQQAKALGVPANQIPNISSQTTTDGVPQRFSFDPVARHYLFITYNKPRIFDDFTAQLVMIANLQDLSTIWSPSISWSTTEWLTLSLLGFFPVRGLDSLGAKRMNTDERVTEYGLSPIAYRAVFEARIFY